MRSFRARWLPQPMMATLAAATVAATAFAGPQEPAPDFDDAVSQMLDALHWREIGPAVMGGRTVDIAGIPGDPSTVYMATASGGLFRTTNHATTWESVFESGGTLSLGAVAVAPSDRNVVYVGTGENNPRNSASIGDGVYRSDDGGDTWRHLGLSDTEKIGRIRVHPTDPDTVWVAALGHEWGANAERGVFRSRDGGATWEHVLFVNEDTGAADLAMDPDNPRILYAGMYDFRRLPWSFRSGGPGSGLYRSSDGGDSWTRLTDPALDNGLPTGTLGRIGVAVAPSDARVVYAIIEAERGVMWRSTDRGASWEMVTEDKTVHSRPFYFSDIRVDPADPNRVYLLEGWLRVSGDGGRTWELTGQTLHGDHQSLWIDPEDANRLINGNDGGWGFSYDRGATWEFVNSVPLGQFYQVSADMREPYHVCGGLQDNHVWCGPNDNLTPLGILNGDWYRIHPGGDGYYIQSDPRDPDIVYTNTHYGNLVRFDRRTGDARAIHPYPVNLRGSAAGEHPYRFNWNSPVHMSPHDPDVVYFGSNVLFRTEDGGQSWAEISPDLTTNDEEKLQVSGGPITPDNTSAEYHGTIIAIVESPVTAGVIWVGTDDGHVQLTRDGGASWERVSDNIPEWPREAWVSRVEASRAGDGIAYVAVDRHRSDDMAPYVYKTTDHGRTWTNIVGNLPTPGYVHVVREDPRNPRLLYVGTELGVWFGGAGGDDDLPAGEPDWTSLRLNLPPVAVRDLLVHPRDNDLIIGTHGRSAWVLDDLTPLQTMFTEAAASGDFDVLMFEPPTATRWNLWNRNHSGYPGQRWLGDQTFYGENPPRGAVLTYLVGPSVAGLDSGGGESGTSADEIAATLTIVDADGNVVRSLEGPADLGLNRVVWDLRHVPLPTPTGTAATGFDPGAAPLALPGRYTVRLQIGSTSSEASFDVRLDPRSAFTPEEARAQFDAVARLTAMEARAMGALQNIEDLSAQVEALLEDHGEADALVEPGREVLAALAPLRARLVRATPDFGYRSSAQLLEKIRQLRSGGGNFPGIEGALAPPTDAQLTWLENFDRDLAEIESELSTAIDGPLGSLNAATRAAGILHVEVRQPRR